MGPQASVHETIDQRIEMGVLDEVGVISTIVLQKHDVGGPEVAEEIFGVNVTIPNAPESEGLFLELECESGVGEGCRTKPPDGSASVELCSEDAGEEGLPVSSENVGDILAREDERGEVARGPEDVDGAELEGYMEDDIMGETRAEERSRLVVQRHERRDGRVSGRADEGGHGWD